LNELISFQTTSQLKQKGKIENFNRRYDRKELPTEVIKKKRKFKLKQLQEKKILIEATMIVSSIISTTSDLKFNDGQLI